MARVVLVGLPGVGKTTTAAALAAALGIPAIDGDAYFEEHRGISVQETLRQAGEAVFRQAELVVLQEILAHDVVLATGGGVVMTPEARALLATQFTVWLDAATPVLASRVADGDRPLLGDDHVGALERLRENREPLYEEVARLRLDANQTVAAIVSQICAALVTA